MADLPGTASELQCPEAIWRLRTDATSAEQHNFVLVLARREPNECVEDLLDV